MKNRYALKSLLYVLSTFIFLITVSTDTFGQDRTIQREILVYISADSLELPAERQQAVSFTEISFSSNRLRAAFQNIPFKKISKTFPEAGKNEPIVQNEDGILVKKPNWERVFTIQLTNENSVKQAIDRLKKEPSIIFAEPHSDMQLHTDNLYPQQWHLN